MGIIKKKKTDNFILVNNYLVNLNNVEALSVNDTGTNVNKYFVVIKFVSGKQLDLYMDNISEIQKKFKTIKIV